MSVRVLGIESSCDDTSIAIVEGQSGHWKTPPKVRAHLTFGQGEMLAKWGGVVPELAARNHVAKMAPLLQQACEQAGIKLGEWDYMAVTTTPGLMGPLLTGIQAVKTLALIFQQPIICINHLHAHLEAIHLTTPLPYPYLGILTSGGHTLFALVTGPDAFDVLGSTIDDAAGEAFDKGGKLLGLGYPAGRIIDDLAKSGDPKRFSFPIGLKQQKNCNLSYSGVKTSMRLQLEQLEKSGELQLGNADAPTQLLKDLCASYQSAIVEAIILKTKVALKLIRQRGLGPLPIVLGGGVACNQHLRARLQEEYKQVYLVRPDFCTDNGAMIAGLGLRLPQTAIPYPKCLRLDAHNRAIERKDFTP